MKNTAFVALGSNLNSPLEQVNQALLHLQQHAHIELICVSSWYRSAPLKDPLNPSQKKQDDYINGVCQISTDLSALELLDTLQHIENQQGRTRGTLRWQSRTLDLDILLFNVEQIDTPRLQVPHGQMLERAFVLYPLHEIAPDLILANAQPLASYLSKVSYKGLEKISVSS